MAIGTELKNILLQDITLTRDRNGEVVINGQVLKETGELAPPTGSLSTSPAFFKVFRWVQQGGRSGVIDPVTLCIRCLWSKIIQI
jgi:hypothetical protein